ncbi:unnamed protein product [Protopolystoma xenopodis]|uniref:Uncharacterized protein n=1 Tax=Protopolystoma xenopodis TaxID=117903 RepID=A0A448WIJ8_9PLAT|nr:unnamed protein product [Protopolystoma xenopodis]
MVREYWFLALAMSATSRTKAQHGVIGVCRTMKRGLLYTLLTDKSSRQPSFGIWYSQSPETLAAIDFNSVKSTLRADNIQKKLRILQALRWVGC